MISKRELYENIIEMQKKHGQGLAGYVGKMDSNIQYLLDELVEEGHITESICYFKTLPDDNWYMPATGYNVWKDDDPRALSFVRMFLGITEEIFLNLPYTDFIQNVEFMTSYATWLEKNHDTLTIMINLDTNYPGNDTLFNEKEVEFIKGKDWYKENKTISECITLNDEYIDTSQKILKLSEDMRRLVDKGHKDYEKNEKRIDSEVKDIKFRKRLASHLSQLDKNKTIQQELNLI